MAQEMDAAWRAVEREAARLKPAHLRDLFAGDPRRFETLSFAAGDLFIDLSKEKLDAAALAALLDLARAAGLEAKREALFSGAAVNHTEGRAVMHMALRSGAGDAVMIDGEDVMPAVRGTLDRMLAFAGDVRSGAYAAADGAAFTDVVNIGIGGSDLGPVMAVRALRPDHDGPRVHFISNVDGAHAADVLAGLDPARTLVLVASKTFTTIETMTNAATARDWLEGGVGAKAGAHMAALSTNIAGAAAFGIEESRVFGFWDWVGGRYSLWSAIGLPIALATGAEDFRAFLRGAADMDAHFRETALEENLPVLLALAGLWRRNAMGWSSVALIPYDQRLERFPAYVQQLDMESNGKSAGARRATGPVVWGEPGTNAQHSFFQLIHQGWDVIPVDFIAARRPRESLGDHHALLLANVLAQGQALAFGKTEEEVRAEMAASGADAAEIDRLAAHKIFPGDRPSTMILHDRLGPYELGRLIALFEHKVFVQGAIWGVNSYDQWGVELGKVLARALIPACKGGAAPAGVDASTAGLLAQLKT